MLLLFFVICCIVIDQGNALVTGKIVDGVRSTHDFIQKLITVDDLCDIMLEDLIDLNNLRPKLFMENLHKTKEMGNSKKFDKIIESLTSDFILFNNLLVEMVLPSKKLLMELLVKAYDFLEKTK